MRLYDAHNHLQDERLTPWRDQLIRQTLGLGVVRMVVNGACEEDWPDVLALAQQTPSVLPSFGYHPWYVHERTKEWQERLIRFLDTIPSGVGEIGLDRWILDRHKRKTQNPTEGHARQDRGLQPGGVPGSSRPASLDEQAEVLTWQLRLAAERNLPASIHCLKAWGLLYEILRNTPRPACGFLLHSYGGPVEMVKPLADLGAYFSLPGYFAHVRKHRQQDTFKHIPPDRLLIETDAPDQCLPSDLDRFQLVDEKSGKPLNHPANLAAVYAFAGELLREPVESLAERVQTNFLRCFGTVC